MKKNQSQFSCNSSQGNQIDRVINGYVVLKSLFSEIFYALGNILLFMGGDDSVDLSVNRFSNKIVKHPSISDLSFDTNGELK